MDLSVTMVDRSIPIGRCFIFTQILFFFIASGLLTGKCVAGRMCLGCRQYEFIVNENWKFSTKNRVVFVVRVICANRSDKGLLCYLFRRIFLITFFFLYSVFHIIISRTVVNMSNKKWEIKLRYDDEWWRQIGKSTSNNQISPSNNSHALSLLFPTTLSSSSAFFVHIFRVRMRSTNARRTWRGRKIRYNYFFDYILFAFHFTLAALFSPLRRPSRT